MVGIAEAVPVAAPTCKLHWTVPTGIDGPFKTKTSVEVVTPPTLALSVTWPGDIAVIVAEAPPDTAATAESLMVQAASVRCLPFSSKALNDRTSPTNNVTVAGRMLKLVGGGSVSDTVKLPAFTETPVAVVIITFPLEAPEGT